MNLDNIEIKLDEEHALMVVKLIQPYLKKLSDVKEFLYLFRWEIIVKKK